MSENPYDPNRFLGPPRTVRFRKSATNANQNSDATARNARVENDSHPEQPVRSTTNAARPTTGAAGCPAASTSRISAFTGHSWFTYVLGAALLASCLLSLAIRIGGNDGLTWASHAFAETLNIPPPNRSFSLSKFTKRQHPVTTIPPQLSAYIEKAVSSAVASAVQDSVGRRDFALAADGARIVPKLTSVFDMHSSNASVRPPTNILDEDLRSGSCWEFPGSHAQVGIKLNEYMFLTHVTVDHVPHVLAADIRQAPREVIVWGAIDGEDNRERLEHHGDSLRRSPLGVLYGGPELKAGGHFLPLVAFEYDIASPPHVQTFPIDPAVVASRMSFGAVVVEIQSNWGASSTRVYRIRIHGEASSVA